MPNTRGNSASAKINCRNNSEKTVSKVNKRNVKQMNEAKLTSRKRKSQDNDPDGSSKQMVGKSNKKGPKDPKIAKCTGQREDKANDSKGETSKAQKSQINNGSCESTEAEINEDGAVFDMNVSSGGASYYKSDHSAIQSNLEDDESESDKNAKGIDSSTVSDGELIDSDTDGQDDCIQRKDELTRKIQVDRRKIGNIDKQLQGRIEELHKLLIKQGGGKSAELLQECIDACKNQEDQIEPGKPKKPIKRVRLAQKNLNQNAKLDALNLIRSESVETIYKPAVEQRLSSSSDEGLEESINNLILAGREQARRGTVENFEELENEIAPGTSGSQGSQKSSGGQRSRQPCRTPDDKAEEVIREAERTRASIFPLQGRDISPNLNPLDKPNLVGTNKYKFTAAMDEDYMVVGAHIDVNLREKIQNGEYIDFAKLNPSR